MCRKKNSDNSTGNVLEVRVRVKVHGGGAIWNSFRTDIVKKNLMKLFKFF